MIGVHDVDNNENIRLAMYSYTFIVKHAIGSTVSVGMSGHDDYSFLMKCCNAKSNSLSTDCVVFCDSYL